MIFEPFYAISSQKKKYSMLEEIISIVRKRNGLSLSFASGETHPGIKRLYYNQTINLHNSEIISLDFDGEDGMWLENASDALIATIYDKIKSSNIGTKAFIKKCQQNSNSKSKSTMTTSVLTAAPRTRRQTRNTLED